VKVHITRVNPNGGKLGVRPCPKASMKIREEILKFFQNKVQSKKPAIVDVEQLPMDPTKRKMVVSGTGSTSSTASKKVMDFGVLKVKGPLGLDKGETLHDIIRKRQTETLRQSTLADHMKKQEKELLHQYGGKFFFTSGIPFNVALNPELWVNF